MANSDVYDVKSGLVAVAATSQTAVLELRSSGTVNKRAFVAGIRIKVGNTAAAAGNNILFTLARAGNTPSGGTAVTPTPHDPASGAAISGAFIGSWATAPTLGAVLGEWELPQASGAMWEEFPPLGYEWVLPVATASIAGFVTNSVATSTPVSFEWVFSE
ncbi:MAG TPA: hypothetical protein VNF47_07575 [Streptosporangiaceae bacterium]|nr:hypothetical protein [Streptosporangiaceae bacterium]